MEKKVSLAFDDAPKSKGERNRHHSSLIAIIAQSHPSRYPPYHSHPSTLCTSPVNNYRSIHHCELFASPTFADPIAAASANLPTSYQSARPLFHPLPSYTGQFSTVGRMAYIGSAAANQPASDFANIHQPAVPSQPLDDTPAATMDQETSISQKMMSAVSGSILTSLLGVSCSIAIAYLFAQLTLLSHTPRRCARSTTSSIWSVSPQCFYPALLCAPPSQSRYLGML